MIYSTQTLKSLVIAAAALLRVPLGGAAVVAAPEAEQVIVFVQPARFEVDRVFQSNQLPAIREVASGLGVPLKVSAVTGTLPAGYSHEAFAGEDLAIIARALRILEPGRWWTRGEPPLEVEIYGGACLATRPFRDSPPSGGNRQRP